jgi:hypothetical protein
MRDARAVADLPDAYDNAGIPRQYTLTNLRLKYISMDLPFSLWLFDDVALVEPYHVGRRKGVPHLCEFAQMIIPKSDINHRLLHSHFQNLWDPDSDRTRPVWTNTSASSAQIAAKPGG